MSSTVARRPMWELLFSRSRVQQPPVVVAGRDRGAQSDPEASEVIAAIKLVVDDLQIRGRAVGGEAEGQLVERDAAEDERAVLERRAVAEGRPPAGVRIQIDLGVDDEARLALHDAEAGDPRCGIDRGQMP